MPTYLVTEKQVWWTWYTVEAKDKREVRKNYHNYKDGKWPEEDGSEGELFEIVSIERKK